MKTNNLILSPFSEKDMPKAYPKFKQALYEVSKAAFGWDEKFQHERFDKAYRPEWVYWVKYNSESVGYVCYKTDPIELHLHLLIIFNEFQGKGFGKKTMDLIHDIAKELKVDVTLSTLKNNVPAVKLYQSLGYEVTEEGEHFLDMILKKNQ